MHCLLKFDIRLLQKSNALLLRVKQTFTDLAWPWPDCMSVCRHRGRNVKYALENKQGPPFQLVREEDSRHGPALRSATRARWLDTLRRCLHSYMVVFYDVIT